MYRFWSSRMYREEGDTDRLGWFRGGNGSEEPFS